MVRCDNMSPDEALIFDIYRGTSHDGPGLRSTVFFKGCPLSCAWCHNPEGQSVSRAVWWDKRSCIGCASCHEVCRTGANSLDADGVHIDADKCVVCGDCVRACPAKALSMIGESYSLDRLMDTVMKDKAFYDQTGGGVTASGGEVMMQADFTARFFRRLHENSVTTALDTCGQAAWALFEKVLPDTDYVLYDLKLMDDAEHRRLTGVGNSLILENACRIAKGIADGRWNTELWIRTPLIPGATATEENLRGIGQFISRQLCDMVSRWELPAFNNSCARKYEKLGESWSFSEQKLISARLADKLRSAGVDGGVDGARIFVTGIVSEGKGANA